VADSASCDILRESNTCRGGSRGGGKEMLFKPSLPPGKSPRTITQPRNLKAKPQGDELHQAKLGRPKKRVKRRNIIVAKVVTRGLWSIRASGTLEGEKGRLKAERKTGGGSYQTSIT